MLTNVRDCDLLIVHTYIHTHTHMHLYTHTCTHIYIRMHMCTRMHRQKTPVTTPQRVKQYHRRIHASIHTHIHIHTYTYTHMCTTCSECVTNVYVGVKTHLCNVHTLPCTSAQNTRSKVHVTLTAGCAHTRPCIYACTCMHMHMDAYAHHTCVTYTPSHALVPKTPVPKCM